MRVCSLFVSTKARRLCDKTANETSLCLRIVSEVSVVSSKGCDAATLRRCDAATLRRCNATTTQKSTVSEVSDIGDAQQNYGAATLQ